MASISRALPAPRTPHQQSPWATTAFPIRRSSLTARAPSRARPRCSRSPPPRNHRFSRAQADHRIPEGRWPDSPLEANAVDAQGAPIAGAVTWQSPIPPLYRSMDGPVTAKSIGSAMLFADANGMRSQPVFVVVAEPKPGALVVSDAQVVSSESHRPRGGRHARRWHALRSHPERRSQHTRCRNRRARIGRPTRCGQVVSTRAEAGNLVVTLEIASLPDVLAR